MNLRTLKKLSKCAAPLLPLLGDRRQQFPAERWDNYHSTFIGDRKHWERNRCHARYEGRNGWTTRRGAEIVFSTLAGHRIVMRPPAHPRKGTVMVGGTDGGEQPEWHETDAWSALCDLVYGHFTAFDDAGNLISTRRFGSPSEILAAARELAAEARR